MVHTNNQQSELSIREKIKNSEHVPYVVSMRYLKTSVSFFVEIFFLKGYQLFKQLSIAKLKNKKVFFKIKNIY